ncbi:uncharacterized protein LOC142767798 [Rhipicephalus microplus]|uniref:uncharacterized protein LOC142767798 n=1 Tax=Rhipicephalus microplus TaxID=6941 RepID=UPI003F6C4090
MYTHSVIGFGAGLSTQDVTKLIKHQIFDRITGDTRAILGLDLEKVSDNVPHELFLQSIASLGPGKKVYDFTPNNIRSQLRVTPISRNMHPAHNVAEFSEEYQASLRPHPPDKPLPDESGFADYLSPLPPVSPYGLSYYRPPPPTQGYYAPPPVRTYLAPMQGYYAPSYYPPPPPVMPRPPLIQPYNPPFLGRYPVVHAPTSGQQEQPFVSTFLYGALVIVSVVLFTLLIATVFAVAGNAGRRSQRRQHRTEVDLVRYSTLPDRHFRLLSSGPMNAGIGAPDNAQRVLFRKHVEKDDVQDDK